MIKRFWQWLKRCIKWLLGKLFGKKQGATQTLPAPSPEPPNDTQCEVIFMELLEGVNQGWSRGNCQGFLIGKQIKAEVLTAWLERFGERLMQSPEQHQELGKRLEQFGNLGWGKLSTVATGLARELIPVEEEVAPEVEVIEAEFAEDGLPRVEPELESPTVMQTADFSPAVEEMATELPDEQDDIEEMLCEMADESPLIETQSKEILEPVAFEASNRQDDTEEILGEMADDLPSLDREISSSPDDSDDDEICFNRGVVLYDLGRLEEALSCFVKILERQSQKSEVWFNLGVILHDLSRFEDAIAVCDRAISIKPDFHQAWINRGVSLNQLGRTQEALTSFNQALKIEPHNPKAWNNRGNVLLKLGKVDRAIACYDRAKELKH